MRKIHLMMKTNLIITFKRNDSNTTKATIRCEVNNVTPRKQSEQMDRKKNRGSEDLFAFFPLKK